MKKEDLENFSHYLNQKLHTLVPQSLALNNYWEANTLWVIYRTTFKFDTAGLAVSRLIQKLQETFNLPNLKENSPQAIPFFNDQVLFSIESIEDKIDPQLLVTLEFSLGYGLKKESDLEAYVEEFSQQLLNFYAQLIELINPGLTN